MQSTFSEFEIFDVRFRISILKGIKVVSVAIALKKKMVSTTRPTIATARCYKLEPVQHSIVFCKYNMPQRSSTGVNMHPTYRAV